MLYSKSYPLPPTFWLLILKMYQIQIIQKDHVIPQIIRSEVVLLKTLESQPLEALWMTQNAPQFQLFLHYWLHLDPFAKMYYCILINQISLHNIILLLYFYLFTNALLLSMPLRIYHFISIFFFVSIFLLMITIFHV